jgi:predicted nucleic acid-binding protein
MICMSDRVFFDTNIFVYATDIASESKRKRAMEIIDFHRESMSVVISTQVLQEYYVTVTRKFKTLLSENKAESAVRSLAKLPVIQIDKEMVLDAIRLSEKHSFSFWDALIVEAAARSGCKKLLSEDMRSGMKIRGLQIENPFVDITQKPAKKRTRAKKKS